MSNWSYPKIFFTGVIAFAAVIGGVWVGGALFQKESPIVHAEQGGYDYEELDARYASFTDGDHFPWENFLYPDGTQGDFDAMRNGRPAIYVFSSTSCGPCLSLLSDLQKAQKDGMLGDPMLVVCVPSDLRPVSEDFLNLCEGMKLVFIERAYWAAQYQIEFWPTVIAVDGSGFVQHIQFGYPNEFDKAFQRLYFRPI